MTFHGKDHTDIAAHQIKHSLKDFLDYFEEVFYETDLEGKIIYVSPTIQKLTGYSVNEVIGKSILEFYQHPEKRNDFIAALLHRGMVEDYELKLIDKNNVARYCSVTSKIQYDAKGNPQRILGILKDNSEKIRQHKDLEESEGKLKALFENAGAQIIYCNVDGNILLINKRAAEYLGKLPEQFKDKNIAEVYEKSLASHLKEKLEQTVSKALGNIFEFKVNDNHQDLWFLTNMQPVTNDKGLITGVVIILNDITDRKDYENELQKLTMAIEKSAASLLITDKDGIISYVNPRFAEAYRIDPENLTGKRAEFFDSRVLGKSSYKELWNKLNSKESWTGERKILRNDGSSFWEEITITPVFNSENEIQNYIRIGMDISASKEFSEFQNKSLKNLEILNETSLKIIKLKTNEDIFQLIGDQLNKLIPNHNFILGSFDEKSGLISNRFLHIEQKLLSVFFKLSKLGDLSSIKSKIDNSSYRKLIKGEFLELTGGFHELTNGKISKKLNDSLIKLFNFTLNTGKVSEF
jgi:PAS domain S-box-containing protein